MEDARSAFDKALAAAEEVGEDISGFEFDENFRVVYPDGSQKSTDSFFLADRARRKYGADFVGGTYFSETDKIVIYRNAFSTTISTITLGTTSHLGVEIVNYSKFQSGLFIVGHELGHRHRSLHSEQRANNYGKGLVDKYCAVSGRC